MINPTDQFIKKGELVDTNISITAYKIIAGLLQNKNHIFYNKHIIKII
jgi:hypothetical protein